MRRISSFYIFCALALTPPAVHAQDFIPASPVGGDRQLSAFIAEELTYPEQAIRAKKEGTVILALTVSDKGAVTSTDIEKHVSPLLDAEALRISRLILWETATFRGKPVESKARIEIPFSVRRYRYWVKNRGYDRTQLPATRIDSSGTVYKLKQLDKGPEPYFTEPGMTFQKFISENFEYPSDALRMNISGVVRVNFIIEPHGRCSNVKIENHIGAGCSEEAVRLVKMFRWKPGLKDDKAVRVNVTLPVTFGLSEGTNYQSPQSPGGTTLY